MANDPPPNRLSLGIAISLIAYLFLSIAAVFVWGFKGRFPTIQIIFVQNVMSFFCVLPLSLRHGWEALKTQELPTHLIRDFFGVLSYYLYFMAIRYLNLVDAATLNYSVPFFVPFVWWIWMREKVERQVWWSIIIGFIGVAIILNPTKSIFQFGFVFGIFAGITSAIALVAVRVLSTKREPMSRILFYYFSIGAMISFPFAWVSWVPPSGYEWFSVTAIGVFTAIGQILLTIAYRYGTAAFLSPLCYSAVIYNGIASYYLSKTTLGWRSYVGTALIILGGTLTYLWRRKAHSMKDVFKSPDKKKPPL